VFFVEPVSRFGMEKVRKNSPANDKGQLNMANEIKIALRKILGFTLTLVVHPWPILRAWFYICLIYI